MENRVPLRIAKEPKIEDKGCQVKLLEIGRDRYPDLTKYFKNYTVPIGIEVECENLFDVEVALAYWKVEEDHSLRHGGIEFVSKPISGHNIDYALKELSDYLDTRSPSWSHRTSIHIHIYVGDFTVEKVKVFVGLYSIFEELFFQFVTPLRRANPYCYALQDLDTEDVVLGKGDMVKYCALNVGTGVANYNTLEFRHLEGTADFLKVRRWIQLIVKLHSYALTNSTKALKEKIVALKSYESNQSFLEEVFGTSAFLFHNCPQKLPMKDGILWAKNYLKV
jgi:hypothetical protein